MQFGKHTSQAVKDFFLALSLANLLMIDPWTRVLGLNQTDVFFRREPPTRMDILGVTIAVLFIAATLWSLTTIIREIPFKPLKVLVRTIFLFVVFESADAILSRTARFWWIQNQLYERYQSLVQSAPQASTVLMAILMIALIAAVVRWGRLLANVAVPLVMLEIPFVLIMFLQAGGKFMNYPKFARQFADQPAIPLTHDAHRDPHVVWLLFDELDQGMIGATKAYKIPIPEIERLKAQSLVATNAVPPAYCTRLSMPAYITGRQIKQIDAQGARDATVTLASNGQAVSLAAQNNIFAEAISAGFKTGIVGWYLPYCRMLRNSFNSCFWEPMYSNSLKTGATIPDNILTQLWNAADTVPMGTFLLRNIDRTARCQHRVAVYKDILAHARQQARDPSVDLLFVHFPIPHPPGFFNAKSGEFDCGGDYVDNVSLVDSAIGDLRAAMTAAGTWDKSIVIISSDHPYREWSWGSMNWRARKESAHGEDHLYTRVPLIVKLPNQHSGRRYTGEFNTVLLHDLILAALHGSFTTAPDLANWITENAASSPPPVDVRVCMPFSPTTTSDANIFTAGPAKQINLNHTDDD